MAEQNGKRRFFSPEFKVEAVRRLEERRAQGVSVTQIGRELDVRPDMLRAWKRQLRERAGAPPTATTSASPRKRRRLPREEAARGRLRI